MPPISRSLFTGSISFDIIDEEIHRLHRLGNGPVQQLLVCLGKKESQDYIRIAPGIPVIDQSVILTDISQPPVGGIFFRIQIRLEYLFVQFGLDEVGNGRIYLIEGLVKEMPNCRYLSPYCARDEIYQVVPYIRKGAFGSLARLVGGKHPGRHLAKLPHPIHKLVQETALPLR